MNDKGQPKERGVLLSEHAVSRSVAPQRLAGRTAARRRLGWQLGAGLSIAVMALLLAPGQEHLRAKGTMNVGHEKLSCESCHTPAPGSVRQQLQANVRYLLGLRKTAADFGNRDVTNADCLACHERPFDRHPVFRFNEPRFEKARAEIGPHLCQSCHAEHTGKKVSSKGTYCSTCHAELEMEQDPIDIPHAKLVAQKRWETCLGCHDFHGNHKRATPKKVSQAFAPARIKQYFAGAQNPYGTALKSPPLKERKHAQE